MIGFSVQVKVEVRMGHYRGADADAADPEFFVSSSLKALQRV